MSSMHPRGAWFAACFLAQAALRPSAQEPALHRDEAHLGRIPIQVRRSGEERGAEGVEVRVLDAADRLWFPEVPPWEVFARMLRHLPGATTDSRGIAWVPEPSGSFGVLAHSAGWIGFAQGMVLPERALEVELGPDPTQLVRVVDASGQPAAGVSAALVALDTRETLMLLEFHASDADGAAELHPGRWRGNERVQRLFALAANGDPRAVLREVDRDAPSAQPLTLALGPTGVIEVVLVDGEGRPVEADGIARFDVAATPVRQRLDAVSLLSRTRIEHGRARFAHAPVGLDLALRADAAGVITSTMDGPRLEPTIRTARLERAGQRLELTFPVNQTLPRVHARVLVAPGEPLVEAPVLVRWFETGAGSEMEDRAITDADGFVSSFTFPGAKPAGEFQLEFSCFEPRLGLRSARVSFELPGPVYHELGDVLLVRAPLLASGRVVDERGEPLVRAVVGVCELPRDGVKRSPPERSRRDIFAITGVDGRFALHGTLDGGELLLEASHDRARSGGLVAVAPGSTDVRLALARTGAIETHVRFDEGRGVQLSIQAIDDSGRVVGRESMRSGTYRIDDLPPGDYTLRCLWSEADSLLVEIPRVVVRAGATTHDPRCEPIDLRGKIR